MANSFINKKADLTTTNLTTLYTVPSFKTAVLKSGATLSGSGLRILRYNAEQAEVEKNIMSYNAKIGQQRKFEEANFARMRGSLARMEAKSAELGYYAKAGESLLRMYG